MPTRNIGTRNTRAVSGFDGHVKLSILNSPNSPEFPDRTVGARACATSTA